MASQPNLALAAILDGANTSADIADELGVSVKHASAVLCKLRRRGYVRWTGRRMPREPGQSGHLCRIYEAVP